MQMFDNLRYCRNNGCSRYNLIISSLRKRCEMCNNRLRGYRGDESFLNHKQDIVIFDGSTSPSQQPITCAHSISIYKPCAKCNRPATPMSTALVHVNSSSYQRPTNVFYTEDHADLEGNVESCDVKGNCPILKGHAPAVHIPFNLFTSWWWLAKKFDTEWFAYLVGTEPSESKPFYWIEPDGMYFPEQDATGGHVRPKSNVELKSGTIASVHSHVDFSAQFSPEDEKHFNWPVELVINRSGKIASMVRAKLECGRYQRVEGRIFWVGAQTDYALADTLESKITVAPQSSVPPKYRDANLNPHVRVIDRRPHRNWTQDDEERWHNNQERFNKDLRSSFDTQQDT